MNWMPLLAGFGVALLLLPVVFELGARWWLRRKDRYYVWLPNLRMEFQPDPEVFPELERRVRFEVNRDGERGGEVPRSEAGVYRILVAGGSPAECALLDQATSWPGVLERTLNKPENLQIFGASRIHVGNIGRSGNASAHLNITFQKVLPQYRHLDLIIIMVGGNDVYDWLQRGAPSVYTPSPVPITEACFICPGRKFGWKLRSSALNQLRREIKMRFLHPINIRQNTGRWVGEARAMRARATEFRNSVPDPKDMLANLEQNYRELLTTAKAHSDRVLAVLQPWFEKNHYTSEEISHFWNGGMGDPHRGDKVTVFYSLEVCSQLMRLVNSRAAKVADDLGVEHLDLMPLLESSLKNYYDFNHFTPAGAAVVSEAIAETLLRVHAGAGGTWRSSSSRR